MTERHLPNGNEPTVFAKCTDCENIYPAQEKTNGNFRPVGTDGSCNCGNEEFALVE